jgi:asparagine N-glycosylation enzyme membrane subunit Stt3
VFVLRFVVLIALVFLVALVGAYLATKDRKYLRIAGKTIQVMTLLVVAFALFYLFERVLLFL